MTKILIVDDEKDIADLISYNLEREGFRARIVLDGNGALAAVRSFTPDLMILDMYLPVQDGLETILMLHHAQSPVKILGISGQPLQGYDILKIAMAFGAHGVLEKPFSRELLLQQVQQLLSPAQQPSL